MSCGQLVVKGLVRGAQLRTPARGAALVMPGHQLAVQASASQLQVRCCAPGVSITQRSAQFAISPQYKQLTVAQPASLIQVPQRAIRLDLRCSPGARGASGEVDVSEAPLLTKVAGETLGGNRAVFVDTDGKFYYADQADEAARVVAGITTGAALASMNATARFAGVMSEPSWTWTPALPIFLSSSGMLTQSPPATGYVVELGRALTPTSMLIEFGTPILRS